MSVEEADVMPWLSTRPPPKPPRESTQLCHARTVVESADIDGGAGLRSSPPRPRLAQIMVDRASLPSNAQIRAQTRLDDRHAPSSQRGGQGVRFVR